MVPTVNDVKLTGDDCTNPWFRGPNPTGGYQLDGRFADSPGAGAAGRSMAHAQVKNMPPQRLLDDLASFQRVLFTNHRVRALSDAISEGTFPLPDPDPPLDELETQGKGVFGRACSVCHGGPGQSTTPISDRSLPRHPDPVSAAVDQTSGAVRLQAVPGRGWPGMRGRTRSSCLRPRSSRRCRQAQRREIRPNELRSGPRAVNRVRRRPHRRSTTGTSSTCPGCAGSGTRRRTSTTTAPTRSKRSSTTTSSSSSSSRSVPPHRECRPRRSPRPTA